IDSLLKGCRPASRARIIDRASYWGSAPERSTPGSMLAPAFAGWGGGADCCIYFSKTINARPACECTFPLRQRRLNHLRVISEAAECLAVTRLSPGRDQLPESPPREPTRGRVCRQYLRALEAAVHRAERRCVQDSFHQT